MALTDFQQRCEALLNEVLTKIDVAPKNRETVPDENPGKEQESIVKMEIKSLNIFIYGDEAQVEDVSIDESGKLNFKSNFCFKKISQKDENQQIKAFVKKVVEMIRFYERIDIEATTLSRPPPSRVTKGQIIKTILVLSLLAIAVLLVFFYWVFAHWTINVPG